jgi:ubiquinone/menaquinone biosynthesis C-methylase UbiE
LIRAPHRPPTRDDRHFDRWSRRYDRSPAQALIFGPVQRAVAEAVSARAGSVGAVLDIGCGTGRMLERLGGRFPGAALAGIDRSAGMLSAGHRLRPELRLCRGDAQALPHPDGCFDAVVTTVSFHHWSDRAAALGEVRRVLRPGGILALADISVDDLPRLPPRTGARVAARMTGMLPLRERRRLVEVAGLRVVDERPALLGRWIRVTVAQRPVADDAPPA